MPLILIVDDDRPTVDLLTETLSQYETVFALEGEAALHQIEVEQPDLVLMDLTMPGMDGASLLPRIREVSSVPIIVLSARAGQGDIVPALKHADDFVAKPFDLDELEARIEVVLRRSARQAVPIEPYLGTFSIGPSRGARIDDQPFHVTPIQFKLLSTLITGEDVSREELAQAGWGIADASVAHLVDVNINRLRSRLRSTPGAPWIVTVRGHGFRLQAHTI